jgi:hypothetical protein
MLSEDKFILDPVNFRNLPVRFCLKQLVPSIVYQGITNVCKNEFETEQVQTL